MCQDHGIRNRRLQTYLSNQKNRLSSHHSSRQDHNKAKSKEPPLFVPQLCTFTTELLLRIVRPAIFFRKLKFVILNELIRKFLFIHVFATTERKNKLELISNLTNEADLWKSERGV